MKATIALLAVALLPLLLSRADAVKLSAFRTCTNLKQHYVRAAILRVGPGGLKFPRFAGLASDSFGRQPNTSGQKKSSPRSGVEFNKPDIIKTDGKRVFTLRGRTLYVTSVTKTGAFGTAKGSIKLPSYGSEILFKGDYVLVLDQQYGTLIPKDKSTKSAPAREGAVTILHQVSIKNNTPVLVSTLRLQGFYIDVGEVSGIARIVSIFNPEDYLQFRTPEARITQQLSTKLNKAILKKTTYKDWIPSYYLSSKKCGEKGCTGPLVGCSNVYRPGNSFGGFGMLSVTAVSITGSLTPLSAAAITGDGRTVHLTATSLYAATTVAKRDFFGMEGGVESGPQFKTSFHKFELFTKRVTYVGSSEVMGSVSDQFSMHEYDGKFFVATTEGAPWWKKRDMKKTKLSSFAVDMKKRQLKKIGEVGNLGKGRGIFWIRYIEDTAYVVTLSQVDPLYIVDLSNPRNLKRIGELKIPGFYSYLHQIAPGRILGFVDDTTPNGRETSVKASLFDMSDKTAPKELVSWTLKGNYISSEWDHKAFLYLKTEKVAVLPLLAYGGGPKTDFTGSIVLDVSDSAIKERGRLSHSWCCGNQYTESIQRHLVPGKNFLWSLSEQQLQIHDILDQSFKSKFIFKQ